MDDRSHVISYMLATMSGICFLGGLVVLSSEGRKTMWTGLRRS